MLLFSVGERSGKPGRGVAKYMSGISQTQDAAGLACSEIGRAKMVCHFVLVFTLYERF